REEERDLDEANSKRDVLLIILTPGVRLNERRSQTHEAQCKFNYREKDRLEGRGERQREDEADAATASALASCGAVPLPCRRESGLARNPSIYMTAVCLGRLLMGEKRVVVIKGTRIPSSSSTLQGCA
ncbi:hypothetical protein WH47_05908, partial [Habropoda laboriosa]